MDVLHPRCAGLDVHKDTVVAGVRTLVANSELAVCSRALEASGVASVTVPGALAAVWMAGSSEVPEFATSVGSFDGHSLALAADQRASASDAQSAQLRGHWASLGAPPCLLGSRRGRAEEREQALGQLPRTLCRDPMAAVLDDPTLHVGRSKAHLLQRDHAIAG